LEELAAQHAVEEDAHLEEVGELHRTIHVQEMRMAQLQTAHDQLVATSRSNASVRSAREQLVHADEVRAMTPTPTPSST
jgi:hypothetical protein